MCKIKKFLQFLITDCPYIPVVGAEYSQEENIAFRKCSLIKQILKLFFAFFALTIYALVRKYYFNDDTLLESAKIFFTSVVFYFLVLYTVIFYYTIYKCGFKDGCFLAAFMFTTLLSVGGFFLFLYFS